MTTIKHEALEIALDTLKHIDDHYETKNHSTQWTRLANRIHKMVRGTVKRGNVITDTRALNTYHADLVYLRKELRKAGYKNPTMYPTRKLKGSLTRINSDLPKWKFRLDEIANIPAHKIKLAISQLKLELQESSNPADVREIYNALSDWKWEHPLVYKLALSKADRDAWAKAQSASLERRSSDKYLKVYNYPKVHALAVEQLSSKSYTALAWGIALLTGRRAIEVLLRGTFEAVDNETILFSGQAKKREGIVAEAYHIPVLYDADKLVSAVERLRNIDNVKAFTTEKEFTQLDDGKLNQAINVRVSKSTNERAKDLMRDKAEQFKNTRGIYAMYCEQNICGHTDQYPTNTDQFLKSILGHNKVDEVKHYRQVILKHEPDSKWLKVKEPAEKPAKTKTTELAHANLKAGKELIEIREALAKYSERSETVRLKVRNVKVKTLIIWWEKAIIWARENDTLKITQTAVTKNIGNTEKSGTGSVDVKTNRYTYQALMEVAGELIVSYNNSGKRIE